MSANPAYAQFLRDLESARNGDHDAVGRLFTMARPYLSRIAATELDSQLRTKLTHSDLVQDVYVEAIHLLNRFHGERPEEFQAWLRAVMLNKVGDVKKQYQTLKRRVGRERPLDEDAAAITCKEPAPSHAVSQREEFQAILNAVNTLPPHYQEIIRRRYWEKLPFAEIGRLTGKSEDAVRMIYARAMLELRRRLEPQV